MQKPRVLIAFHDPGYLLSLENLFKLFGYDVVTAETEQDMLSVLKDGNFQLCLMDVNLGRPGEKYTEPAEKAYEIIRRGEESTRFLALSGDPEIVRYASDKGLPCKTKASFNIREFIYDTR